MTTPEAGFFSESCDAGNKIIAAVANTSNLTKKFHEYLFHIGYF